MSLSFVQVGTRANLRGARALLGVALAIAAGQPRALAGPPSPPRSPSPPETDAEAVLAGPDAHRCLDAVAVRAEVEEWLGHPLGDELTVVLRGDEGFGFDMLRGDEQLGRRRFADEGQSCAQVVQIVGLAVAMAVEDQMTAWIAPLLPAVDATPESPETPTPEPPTPESARERPTLGLGPVIGASSLPAWGFELGAVLRWQGLVGVRAELDLGYRPRVVLRDASSVSRAVLLDAAAQLELCLGSRFRGRRSRLDACLGLRGGPMFARGLDLAPNSWALAGWLAASSGVLLSVPAGPVHAEIGASLLVSLVDPRLRTVTPDQQTAQTWTGADVGGRLVFALKFDGRRQVRGRPDSKGPR